MPQVDFRVSVPQSAVWNCGEYMLCIVSSYTEHQYEYV